MAEEVQEQAAEASESSESSEATIAVHWREEGYYLPPPKFIGQANGADPHEYRACWIANRRRIGTVCVDPSSYSSS